MNDKQVTFRIKTEDWDKFKYVVENEGKLISKVLRQLMSYYVDQRSKNTKKMEPTAPQNTSYIQKLTCQFCKKTMPAGDYSDHYRSEHDGSQM